MKKRILSEGNVRRMMKLANIGALTENFIEETDEIEENGEGDYAESIYEQEDEEEDEGGLDLGGEEDMGLDDEPDLGGEEEGEPDADDLSDFLEFINDKVEDYAEMKGIDLEVEFEEEGEEDDMGMGLEDEDDMDMGPEEPLDLGGPEGEEGDEDMMPEPEEGPAMMSEALQREIENSLDAAGVFIEEDVETDLINEVTRRVANRLLQARARKE